MEKKCCKRMIIFLVAVVVVLMFLSSWLGVQLVDLREKPVAPVTENVSFYKSEIGWLTSAIAILQTQIQAQTNALEGCQVKLAEEVKSYQNQIYNQVQENSSLQAKITELQAEILRLQQAGQKATITFVSLPTPVKQLPCSEVKNLLKLKDNPGASTFPNANAWGTGNFPNGLIDVFDLEQFKLALEKIPRPPVGVRDSSYVSWLDTHMGNGSYGLGYAGKGTEFYAIIILSDKGTIGVYGIKPVAGQTWRIWRVGQDTLAQFAIIGNG